MKKAFCGGEAKHVSSCISLEKHTADAFGGKDSEERELSLPSLHAGPTHPLASTILYKILMGVRKGYVLGPIDLMMSWTYMLPIGLIGAGITVLSVEVFQR